MHLISICVFIFSSSHLPSISYSSYISGNKLNTCSCHSCRHPDTSGRQNFPEKEKQQDLSDGDTVTSQQQAETWGNAQHKWWSTYVNAWINVLILNFSCIFVHLHLWIYGQYEEVQFVLGSNMCTGHASHG